jgi:general secretion pathway protein C
LEAAPVTTLSLLLKGVIAAQPMSRALAIIADKGGSNEQLYGLGEQIPGNASIREIHADRVIISRGGILETLLLEGSQSAETTRPSPSGNSRSPNLGAAKISAVGNGNNYRIEQDYWEERLADLPGLSREVGVEIYKEDDEQRGYKLLSSQGSRLLTSLGLQPGDILLSVNGRPMNSVQEGLAAYQQIRNGGRVQIEIIRNGRRESRVYDIGG